jgi:hypothetical protein
MVEKVENVKKEKKVEKVEKVDVGAMIHVWGGSTYTLIIP